MRRDAANAMPVRAGTILRSRAAWLPALVVSAFMAVVMAFGYIGAITDPAAHLRGLPVMIVNQDRGVGTTAGHEDFGAEIVAGLESSRQVTSKLALHNSTLTAAHAELDRAGAYATLVIPADFSASLLRVAGADAGSTGGLPGIEIQTTQRLGSIGASFATAVLTPAIEAASAKLGHSLLAQATTATRTNAVNAARLADPIALTTQIYQPLQSHSAVGLSAFYASVLALLSGFLGAILVGMMIDALLGYAPNEYGPFYRHRQPLAISRVRTYLVKLVVSGTIVPILLALILLVGHGIFGMDAPNVVGLWLCLSLAAISVAWGTLTLLAIFGTVGQMLAMILFIYLALNSSGGTVPVQALPGFFKAIATIEPFRHLVVGARAIMYFDGRGDAGLNSAIEVLVAYIVFWLLLGFGLTSWYDRRGLHRIHPNVIDSVRHASAVHAGDESVTLSLADGRTLTSGNAQGVGGPEQAGSNR